MPLNARLPAHREWYLRPLPGVLEDARLWMRVQRHRSSDGGLGTTGLETGMVFRDTPVPRRGPEAPLPERSEPRGHDEAPGEQGVHGLQDRQLNVRLPSLSQHVKRSDYPAEIAIGSDHQNGQASRTLQYCGNGILQRAYGCVH